MAVSEYWMFAWMFGAVGAAEKLARVMKSYDRREVGDRLGRQ